MIVVDEPSTTLLRALRALRALPIFFFYKRSLERVGVVESEQ